MPIRPLNDTIFIEPDENQFFDSNPEVVRIAKEGLIALPEDCSIEKAANTGLIISWGDKCSYKEHYRVGMKVMFRQFGGCYFYHEGKRLKSLLEDEILGIYA